ncbi:MAG TPA: BamA/TamA family outer membrane protein [Myxococcota bacterium]|nr:BamA/TamA family outer membrane protein [Myxococcota bacterium]
MRARTAIPLWLALAAALCAPGAARPADVHAAEAPAPEKPAVRVRSLSFTGVQAMPVSDLEPRLFTSARPWWNFWGELPEFDLPTLDGDMQRIAAVYRERGYYATHATYKVEPNPAGDEVRIAIAVEEGPPVLLASWAIDLSALPGGDARWRAQLVDKLPLKKGAVFSVDTYGAAKRALLRGIENLGFPDVALDGGGDVDLATNEATIAWTARPGPRVTLGVIRIEGMETVGEEVIRRELAFKSGDLYKESELEQSQRQVSDLGLFRTVQIALQTSEEEAPGQPPPTRVTRDVVVRVEERPLHSVRIGAGYGTEDKLRAQVGWLHRNVSGRADTLDIRAKYSSLTDEFQATLREPHVPDPRTTLYLDSRIRDDTLPAYDDLTLLSSVSIQRALRLGWSGHLGYDVEWTDVRSVPSAAATELKDPTDTFLLSYLDLGVRRITTDSLVTPSHGTWLELSIETAGTWLGSQRNYVRGTADARGYLPLGPTVLAARLMLGTITPYASTESDELPVTKLFYGGGSAIVRGYDFQHLGPRDLPGSPVGGDSLIAASVEWRFPIWRELHGDTFVDAGQLSRQPFDWKPEALRYSGGVGLRYATPLGPIRLDVATPINPPPGVDRVRFWFAIGEAF